MNIIALAKNIQWSWDHSLHVADGAKLLYWTYASKLPNPLRRKELKISLRYSEPVNTLRIVARTNGADRFIFGEVFDHQYYELKCAPFPATVLDVGANVGFTSIYLARCFPGVQIACVEPESGNLMVLRENLRLNQVSATVFPFAVSTQDGIEELSIHAKDYGHHILQESTEGRGKTIIVPSITVPTLLRHLGWSRVGLLKMDIEGFEKHLFTTDCSWLRLVDHMFIEWHDELEAARAALSDLAAKYGFAPPRLLPGIWLLSRD